MDSPSNKSLKEVLNSHYGTELSEQDFSQAEKNLLGFLECLLEIDLEQKQGGSNENKNQ